MNLIQAQEEETTFLLIVHGEKKEEMVLLNEDKVFPALNGNDKDTWYLDNGASNHMTGVRDYFAELDENITRQLKFGDGSKVQIKVKGTILLNCKNKEQLVIVEVYYIPYLCNSILSLGQITEEGYGIEMKKYFLKMHDKYNRLLMMVQCSKNRLYKIVLHTTQPFCLHTKIDNIARLLHTRLGDVNFRLI